MEQYLHRIRVLSPAKRRLLDRTFAEWLASRPDRTSTTKTLTVFYVAKTPLAADDVRAFLRARLPDHLVPSAYVQVDALPRTVNGKIDRRALEGRRSERADVSAPSGSAATSDRERQLIAIWREILHVPTIGVDDNFFELGGHSLLATQVIMEIEQRFEIEIPLGAVFRHPTVAALCRHLDTLTPPAAPTRARADRGDAADDIPLSNAQRRLWYASQVSDEGLEYRIAKVLELRGALNVAALAQSVAEVVHRHESLRTAFGYQGGRLVQKIAPHEGVLAPDLVDLASLPPESRDRAYDTIEAGVLQRPFDLEVGPLLRLTLVRYSSSHARLIFDVHHIVIDGWSFGILVQELNALFRRFARGVPSELAPLVLQYRDVARWEKQHVSQSDLDRQLAYWRTKLAGLPRLDFERAMTTPHPRTADGEMAFALAPELWTNITEVSGRLQITPFILLASIYHLLLHLQTGSLDHAIGTAFANRGAKGHADLIGFFVNQVVLRVSAGERTTFRELCLLMRESVEGAFANKDLPYDTLVRELSPRSTERSSLIRAMFTFHHQLPDIAIDGIATSFVDVRPPTTKYDLLLNVEQGRDGLSGSFEYSGAVFDADAIAGMIEQLTTLAEEAVYDIDAPIAMLRDIVLTASRVRARQQLDDQRASRQRDLRQFLAGRRTPSASHAIPS